MTKIIVSKFPRYGEGKPKKSVTFRLSPDALETLEENARAMRWTKTQVIEFSILEAPLPLPYGKGPKKPQETEPK